MMDPEYIILLFLLVLLLLLLILLLLLFLLLLLLLLLLILLRYTRCPDLVFGWRNNMAREKCKSIYCQFLLSYFYSNIAKICASFHPGAAKIADRWFCIQRNNLQKLSYLRLFYITDIYFGNTSTPLFAFLQSRAIAKVDVQIIEDHIFRRLHGYSKIKVGYENLYQSYFRSRLMETLYILGKFPTYPEKLERWFVRQNWPVLGHQY